MIISLHTPEHTKYWVSMGSGMVLTGRLIVEMYRREEEGDFGNVSEGGRERWWKCIGGRKREIVETYRWEEERDCGNVFLLLSLVQLADF